MPLTIHLLIHLSLAILTGYLAGKYFKRLELGILCGFIGGFLIDFDHVLEYFLVYGFSFDLMYFLQGRQFLISDQVRIWFHAWEYLPMLLLLAFIFRKKQTIKVVLITLALAGSVHLLSDSVINRQSLQFYSLINRASVDFSAKDLMRPEEYELNQKWKREMGL